MTNLRWKIAQKAELRWWQHYLGSKPKTEYLEWKRAYWKTFLQQTGTAPGEGDKVLDAGCGPAGIFTVLKDHRVIALDPLLEHYESQLEHFNKSDYPNVEFVNQSIEAYPDSEIFDTVFCLNAINHVADLHKSIEKLISLTKPGGRLVLSVDAHNFNFLKPLFRLIPGDVLHPHQYDLQEYVEMLTSRGIAILKSMLYKKAFLFNYYVLVCERRAENL